MKWFEKKKYIAGLLLLALTACTQNDIPDIPTEGDLISFSIPEVVAPDGGKPGTRATLVSSTLPVSTRFGVLGYCVPLKGGSTTEKNPSAGTSPWDAKKILSTPDVLNQAPLRVEDYGCYYTDNTKVGRWYTDQSFTPPVSTAGFQYTFIAYYPYTGRFGINTPSSGGAPKLTYTVAYGSNSNTGGDGLGTGYSFYRIPRDPTLAIDAMYAQTKDHTRESGAVNLQFHHIMSGFSVQLNNYNEESVTVTSVVLDGGFYRTETIDFSTPDPTLTVGSQQYWGSFEFMNGSTIVPGGSAVKAGATDEKPDGTVVLLLPNLNSTTAEGAYLGTSKKITVRYVYNGIEKSATIENFTLGRKPEPGLNYRLNINFMGDQLLLMFTADEVEYWEEGSDNNIIIN